MRRVILFHFFITMAFIANAQLFNPYFQIEAGIAVNREKTGVFRTEVGATFNWLDVGLVLDRESNSFFKEYNGEIYIFKNQVYDPVRNHNDEFDYFANTSLQLTAKIDIIRFFKDNSRHAFKIGGGYGVIRYQKAWSHFRLNDDSKFEYELATTSNFGLLGSFKLGYEYEILPKFKMGVTFGGTYYPALSILLRKDF